MKCPAESRFAPIGKAGRGDGDDGRRHSGTARDEFVGSNVGSGALPELGLAGTRIAILIGS